MSESSPVSAFSPAFCAAATPWAENPAACLEAHYRRRLAEGSADQTPGHGALAVSVVGFERIAGDWLGVVVTPWFLDLFLMAGGGSLWGDIPVGQRRYVNLAGGTLPFLAAADPAFGPYQHTPLIEPVTAVPDMATALRLAREAMATLRGTPAAPPTPTGAPEVVAPSPEPAPSRRAFFRRLAGRR